MRDCEFKEEGYGRNWKEKERKTDVNTLLIHKHKSLNIYVKM